MKSNQLKITLVPTYQINKSYTSLYKGTGILLLSSIIKNKIDVDVEIIDLIDYGNLLNQDEEKVLSEIVDKILSTEANIVGFSTLLENLPIAITLCKMIKKLNPEIITLLGGLGVSFSANEIIKNYLEVDLILRGEADKTIVELLSSLKSNFDTNKLADIEGLVYKRNGKIIDNGWPTPIESLDELPMVDYSSLAFKPHNYNLDFDYVAVEVGRGCPYNCIFCATANYFNKKLRLKSIDGVIRELENVNKYLPDRRVFLVFDLLTIDKNYLYDLCNEIEKRFTNLRWVCLSITNHYDYELFKKMYDSGCRDVFFGLETHSQRMMDYVKKRLDLNRFDEIIEGLNKIGYRDILFTYTVGYPEIEDISDIEITLKKIIYYKTLNPDFSFRMFPLMPTLGSEIFEKWKHSLEYDEYNKVGFCPIPVNWENTRALIKSDSIVFSTYYNYKLDNTANYIKYQLICHIISNILENSLRIAYLAKGPGLISLILQNLDEIELNSPIDIDNDDISKSINSFITLLCNILVDEEHYIEKFADLSHFEKIKYQLSNELSKNHKINSEIIKTKYDPFTLISILDTHTTQFENCVENQPLKGLRSEEQYFTMIYLDEVEQEIKFKGLSPQIANMLKVEGV